MDADIMQMIGVRSIGYIYCRETGPTIKGKFADITGNKNVTDSPDFMIVRYYMLWCEND